MKNKKVNVIILLAVLIIPFLYSFFYLKAYWNPYGEGNIDNLPIVIVNDDEGDKGSTIIKSIKDSKKLKVTVLNKDEAEEGLNDGTYYALINIPTDFTSSLESASSENKKHATITYSPNQKSNFLASQIINSVVNAVEKNLDNEVNAEIVGSLSESLNKVPTSLDTISDGFSKLENGTSDLLSGSTQIKNGAESLNNGLNTLQASIATLNNGASAIDKGLSMKIKELQSTPAMDQSTLAGIKQLAIKGVESKFTDEYKNQIGTTAGNQAVSLLASNPTYSAGKAQLTAAESQLAPLVSGFNTYSNQNLNTYEFCNSYLNGSAVKTFVLTTQYDSAVSTACTAYVPGYNSIKTLETTAYQVAYNTAIQTALTASKETAGNVSASVATQVATTAQNTTIESLKALNSNTSMLANGMNELATSDKMASLYKGASDLSAGTSKLQSGISLLNSSVSSSHKVLSSNITSTKNDLSALDGLKEYSKAPVTIENNTVNEIDSYGVAFAPLFICIGLWVGCLMFYVVLYYDKNQRFKVLGKDSKEYLKRTICYHGMATAAGIILGLLLHILLGMNLANIPLYYISVILIANMFVALMEFLIVNLDDVGKFLALIILVLQLAASGGTFPIETVTKGFRWLHNFLPMTYTINLLKEPIVSLEGSLFGKNLIIVIVLLVVLTAFNIFNDIRKQNIEK